MTAFLSDPPPRIAAFTDQLYTAGAMKLQRGDWAGAFRDYRAAYKGLLNGQPPGQRFHKGLPLHNMGLARVLGNRPRAGLQYTALAFLEDAISKADEGAPGFPELDGPAAHNLVYAFALPPRLLAEAAHAVRQFTARGELFQDPSPLAALLGLTDLWSGEQAVKADQPRIGERAFAAVEARLRAADIAFERAAALNGLQVDFLVRATAATVVLEVKSASRGGQADFESWKAAAESLRGATHATRVFVVVPDEIGADLNDPVVKPISRIAEAVRSVVGGQPTALPRRREEKPRIFAAMPFSRKYHDTFFNAIRRAAQAVGATAVRIDHDPDPGDVVQRIKVEIERAAVVVADVSEARPSVLHEYGYAEARGKTVIAITSSDTAATPFNVSHNSTHAYALGSTDLLRRKLSKLLRAELRRQGLIPPDRRRKS